MFLYCTRIAQIHHGKSRTHLVAEFRIREVMDFGLKLVVVQLDSRDVALRYISGLDILSVATSEDPFFWGSYSTMCRCQCSETYFLSFRNRLTVFRPATSCDLAAPRIGTCFLTSKKSH